MKEISVHDCCVDTYLLFNAFDYVKMGWLDGYIEPAIGHMKMDGKLSRNPLKGALGDALHAVMCGAGHNMRMLLRKLRLLCAQFGVAMQEVLRAISLSQRPNYRVVI